MYVSYTNAGKFTFSAAHRLREIYTAAGPGKINLIIRTVLLLFGTPFLHNNVQLVHGLNCFGQKW